MSRDRIYSSECSKANQRWEPKSSAPWRCCCQYAGPFFRQDEPEIACRCLCNCKPKSNSPPNLCTHRCLELITNALKNTHNDPADEVLSRGRVTLGRRSPPLPSGREICHKTAITHHTRAGHAPMDTDKYGDNFSPEEHSPRKLEPKKKDKCSNVYNNDKSDSPRHNRGFSLTSEEGNFMPRKVKLDSYRDSFFPEANGQRCRAKDISDDMSESPRRNRKFYHTPATGNCTSRKASDLKFWHGSDLETSKPNVSSPRKMAAARCTVIDTITHDPLKNTAAEMIPSQGRNALSIQSRSSGNSNHETLARASTMDTDTYGTAYFPEEQTPQDSPRRNRDCFNSTVRVMCHRSRSPRVDRYGKSFFAEANDPRCREAGIGDGKAVFPRRNREVCHKTATGNCSVYKAQDLKVDRYGDSYFSEEHTSSNSGKHFNDDTLGSPSCNPQFSESIPTPERTRVRSLHIDLKNKDGRNSPPKNYFKPKDNTQGIKVFRDELLDSTSRNRKLPKSKANGQGIKVFHHDMMKSPYRNPELAHELDKYDGGYFPNRNMVHDDMSDSSNHYCKFSQESSISNHGQTRIPDVAYEDLLDCSDIPRKLPSINSPRRLSSVDTERNNALPQSGSKASDARKSSKSITKKPNAHELRKKMVAQCQIYNIIDKTLHELEGHTSEPQRKRRDNDEQPRRVETQTQEAEEAIHHRAIAPLIKKVQRIDRETHRDNLSLIRELEALPDKFIEICQFQMQNIHRD